MLRSFITLFCFTFLLTSCKKSPKEIWESLRNKKLKARKIEAEKPEAPKLPPAEPVAAVAPVAPAVEEFEQPTLTEAPPKTTPTFQITHRMCQKLIRTFKDEPFFYQFQANIRKHMEAGGTELSDFIASHMRYHSIRDIKRRSAATKHHQQELEQCGQVIAGIDRFQYLNTAANLGTASRTKDYEKLMENFSTYHKKFSLQACANVLSQLENADEYRALRDELSIKEKSAAAVRLVTDLMSEFDKAHQRSTVNHISTYGCTRAIQSFASFDDLQSFNNSTAQAKLDRIGGYATFR